MNLRDFEKNVWFTMKQASSIEPVAILNSMPFENYLQSTALKTLVVFKLLLFAVVVSGKIVVLQCWVNFCCTMKWLIHIYTYILSLLGLPPTQPPILPSRSSQSMELSFPCILTSVYMGVPSGSEAKNLPANAGGVGLIPGLGRSPGEGNGNLFQYFLPGKSHGQRSLRG